jgi:hypothetical protein
LLEHLTGNANLTPFQLNAANVNTDKKVDYLDYNDLVSHILSGKKNNKFLAGEWKFPEWTFTAGSKKNDGDGADDDGDDDGDDGGDDDDNHNKASSAVAGPDGPITIVSTGDISSELPPVIKNELAEENKVKEFKYNENQYELILPISI